MYKHEVERTIIAVATHLLVGVQGFKCIFFQKSNLFSCKIVCILISFEFSPRAEV